MRTRILSLLSFLCGLFAIPALVLADGSLILSAVLAIAAIGTGLAEISARSARLRALAISGFAMGVAALWYTITGWAIGLDIASSIESLF